MNQDQSLHRVAMALAAALRFAPLPAQAPPAWVDLAPPGGANAAAVTAMGKLVLYRDGTFLRVFSAVTGRWHAQSLSYGTAPRLSRDLLLIPESDRWTAFSAYRGVFVPLFVNLATTGLVLSESIALVTDGNQLHAFSAFTGQWHVRTIPAGWVLVDIGPRMVVIGDLASVACTGASAFDVYTGQWHDLPAQTRRLQGVRSKSGTCVILDFVQYTQAISMQRPGWVQRMWVPFVSPSTYPGEDSSDFVSVRGEFFSGLNGAFHQPPPTFDANFSVYGLLGTGTSLSQEFVCSMTGNAWTVLPAGVWRGPVGTAFALYELGGQAFAYSAVRDTVSSVNSVHSSSPYWAAGSYAGSGSVVTFLDSVTNLPVIFSALTGQWHAAPGNAAPVMPVVARTAALLQTTDGVAAFSARSGAFVPWPGSGLLRHGAGNLIAATDGSTLAVFDARLDRWRSAPSTSQSPSLGSSVLVAVDSTRALGFGARAGSLEELPLNEPALATAAVDDVGYVRTANHVFAFRGFGDDLPWLAFPEDEFACGLGTTLRRQVRLHAGDFAIVGFGPRAAAPLPLAPYGDVWLDLVASSAFVLGALPGEERAVLALPVPEIPALENSEWWLQSLTLPAAGAPYLGEPASVRVL